MAKKIDNDQTTIEAEEAFLSLVFPMKKKWVARRPEVRAQKSVVKQRVSKLITGTKEKRSKRQHPAI